MYSYFKGKITEIGISNITLEVSNIGYLVQVFNPSSFSLNEEITLYIYQYIREDINILYGFRSSLEKQTFLKLLNVKGLGPKGALSITSSTTVDEIKYALDTSNASFFSSFPGIGPKLASQIIIDLKGKFKLSSDVIKDDLLLQVSSALKSLGYNASEVKVVVKNLKVDYDTPVEECIKQALKILKQ